MIAVIPLTSPKWLQVRISHDFLVSQGGCRVKTWSTALCAALPPLAKQESAHTHAQVHTSTADVSAHTSHTHTHARIACTCFDVHARG